MSFVTRPRINPHRLLARWTPCSRECGLWGSLGNSTPFLSVGSQMQRRSGDRAAGKLLCDAALNSFVCIPKAPIMDSPVSRECENMLCSVHVRIRGAAELGNGFSDNVPNLNRFAEGLPCSGP